MNSVNTFPNWWQSILLTILMSIIIIVTVITKTIIEQYYGFDSEFLLLLQYVLSVGLVAAILFLFLEGKTKII